MTVLFSCVVVESLSGGGHVLFGSGPGSDGKTYYVTVTDPDSSSAGYYLLDQPWRNGPCGATPPWDYMWGLFGDFEIQP
ncbi:MAG TPA: hypothetical protein VHJ78_01175 [Actinomycetota bacterium]|nr:hypothetical protein [Actinomycetota bacterium]